MLAWSQRSPGYLQSVEGKIKDRLLKGNNLENQLLQTAHQPKENNLEFL